MNKKALLCPYPAHICEDTSKSFSRCIEERDEWKSRYEALAKEHEKLAGELRVKLAEDVLQEDWKKKFEVMREIAKEYAFMSDGHIDEQLERRMTEK